MDDFLRRMLDKPKLRPKNEERLSRLAPSINPIHVRIVVRDLRERSPSNPALREDFERVARAARALSQALDSLGSKDDMWWREGWIEVEEAIREPLVKAEREALFWGGRVRPRPRGRERAALGDAVARLRGLCVWDGVEASASPAGEFYQAMAIIWDEVFGPDQELTPDAVRKALSRTESPE